MLSRLFALPPLEGSLWCHRLPSLEPILVRSNCAFNGLVLCFSLRPLASRGTASCRTPAQAGAVADAVEDRRSKLMGWVICSRLCGQVTGRFCEKRAAATTHHCQHCRLLSVPPSATRVPPDPAKHDSNIELTNFSGRLGFHGGRALVGKRAEPSKDLPLAATSFWTIGTCQLRAVEFSSALAMWTPGWTPHSATPGWPGVHSWPTFCLGGLHPVWKRGFYNKLSSTGRCVWWCQSLSKGAPPW